MNSLYSEGLNQEMKLAYNAFDNLCRWYHVPYSIDCDLPNEQGYLVSDRQLVPKILEHLQDKLINTKVGFNIDENRRDGVLFHFITIPIIEDEKLGEDQYKFGTGKHTLKQSSYPAEITSQSFGGVKTPRTRARKRRAKINECYFPGVRGTISKNLVCHDNVTIIPKNSEIAIIDMDRHLPDVEWEGKIFNVDHNNLWDAFKPHDSFADRLENKLGPPETVDLSGAVQFMNNDILASLHQK